MAEPQVWSTAVIPIRAPMSGVSAYETDFAD